jgi:hypothetical protein
VQEDGDSQGSGRQGSECPKEIQDQEETDSDVAKRSVEPSRTAPTPASHSSTQPRSMNPNDVQVQSRQHTKPVSLLNTRCQILFKCQSVRLEY